jgi:hypothetical protein
MSNNWVRLWHDMPTDPKWRVIARKSGQRIGDVIAVFNFMMVNASANANERGRTQNLFADDIGAALDMDEADVTAILIAMHGKVVDGEGWLLGWEKRQPIREDGSAERAREWRRERKRTQANAQERPDKDTDTDKKGSNEPYSDWSKPPVEGVSAQVWKDFKANRKKRSLANTPTAYKRLKDDLNRLSNANGWEPARLIEIAAERGWGGIYLPIEGKNGNGNDVGKSAAAFAALDASDDRPM